MHWQIYISILVLSIPVLGCDSNSGADPGSIVSQILPDTSYYLNTVPTAIQLDQYFTQSAGHNLHFSVAHEGDAVSVSIIEARLLIVPEQLGASVIKITIADSFENSITSSFHVTVLDPCPAEPNDNGVNYFPITYSYIYFHIRQ